MAIVNPLPDSRDCVLVIQGGGLNGLPLLGQAEAILKIGGYLPWAFAGTSAGAIVAALLWAGMDPTDVRARIIAEARKDPQRGLARLLDPRQGGPDPEFGEFVSWIRDGKLLLSSVFSSREDPLEDLVSRVIRAWRTFQRARRLYRAVGPRVKDLGVFSGAVLEDLIDSWVKEAVFGPPVQRRGSGCPEDRLLTFRDVMLFDGPVARPPLFITATNLRTGALEVINSVDPEYQHTPIARAARASGGAPGFFKPTDIPQAGRGGIFVDGGMVSNFPAWIFSDELWRKFKDGSDYRALIRRPLLQIGLRIEYPANQQWEEFGPVQFGRAVSAIALGGARNQLEEMLARASPRPITVRQFSGNVGGPPSVFDFSRIDAELVGSMIDSGYQCARTHLETLKAAHPAKEFPSIYRGAGGDEAVPLLGELIDQTARSLGRSVAGLRLRANLFLPYFDRFRMAVSLNMENDPDRDMSFGIETGGVTAFCYYQGCAAITNFRRLTALRDAAGPNETHPLLIHNPDLEPVRQVTPPVSWLLTYPIFDLFDVRDVGSEPPVSLPAPLSDAVYAFRPVNNAAIVGILNLDASLDYADLELPEDPNTHLGDPRVRATLVFAESIASRLAWAIAEQVERRSE